VTESLTIKMDALEPLYEAWEEPNKHRVHKDTGEGGEQNRHERSLSMREIVEAAKYAEHQQQQYPPFPAVEEVNDQVFHNLILASGR
jgi:hypothetical protein